MGLQHLELKADARLREALRENADLRLELARLETQTNHLQGYGLDGTSAEDLARLIESLTQVWSDGHASVTQTDLKMNLLATDCKLGGQDNERPQRCRARMEFENSPTSAHWTSQSDKPLHDDACYGDA